MSPDPTAAPRPAKDGTQPPAQPWGRRDVRYVAAFISGRRSLWPASFSELLSSGFPLVKKPELKRTRESSEPSQHSPGSPWPSVSSGSLLALQKPRPAFCPRRSGCGARVSAPHNQPLDRPDPSSSYSGETSGLSPPGQGFDIREAGRVLSSLPHRDEAGRPWVLHSLPLMEQ